MGASHIAICLMAAGIFMPSWSEPLNRGRDSRGSRPVDPTVMPKFVSRGQTFRAVIGDTLVLPCEVEDLGEYVLLWRRGSSVISAGTLMVTRNTRLRLIDGYNLEINNVMPQDAGDYVCQISDIENRDQIHTVEILVPPSIKTQPASGQLTARKGGTITMECKASGNPVPSIQWTRKNNVLPTGEKMVEGFSITLEMIDRHQSGVYQCTASNGVGDPVTVDMQLDVLYPPEIEVERSWVHSGEGYEAQLVCIVHGEPPPEILWYQDSFQLDQTERRTMETRGNKHTLTIRNVQSSDFGNYSCVAENSLGRAKKYMELSGRPSPAEFKSTPYSRAKDSYNLTWVVESYPPLEEVRLLYRKLMMNETYQRPGKWHDVILNPDKEETFSHVMSHNIRGLDPGSAFEAIVQAKNRYGWNEVSDLYQFYTRGQDLEETEILASSTKSIAHMSRQLSAMLLVLLFNIVALVNL